MVKRAEPQPTTRPSSLLPPISNKMCPLAASDPVWLLKLAVASGGEHRLLPSCMETQPQGEPGGKAESTLMETNHFCKARDLSEKRKKAGCEPPGQLRDPGDEKSHCHRSCPLGRAGKLCPAPSTKDALCATALRSSPWALGSIMVPLSPLKP